MTVGHGRNIQNWRVDSNDFKTNGIPNDGVLTFGLTIAFVILELDKIFDAMEGTADVVEADAHLKRIREIFDNAKNDANMVEQVLIGGHFIFSLRRTLCSSIGCDIYA